MTWFQWMLGEAKESLQRNGYLIPVLCMRREREITTVDLREFQNSNNLMSWVTKSAIAMFEPAEYILFLDSWVKHFDEKDEGERFLARQLQLGFLQVSDFSKQPCITAIHGKENKEIVHIVTYTKLDSGEYQFEELAIPEKTSGEGIFANLRQ